MTHWMTQPDPRQAASNGTARRRWERRLDTAREDQAPTQKVEAPEQP